MSPECKNIPLNSPETEISLENKRLAEKLNSWPNWYRKADFKDSNWNDFKIKTLPFLNYFDIANYLTYDHNYRINVQTWKIKNNNGNYIRACEANKILLYVIRELWHRLKLSNINHIINKSKDWMKSIKTEIV